MTPQSTFMILATIIPAREAELRSLLASMNHEPGRVNPLNPILPFKQLKQVHFARILILDDQTLDDIRVYGMPRVNYPTYLAILGDCDGSSEALIAAMVRLASDGLHQIFTHCEGFAPGADLLAWVKAHDVSPAANYVNWVGRTVQQVAEEDILRQVVEKFIQSRSVALSTMQPLQVRNSLKAFVAEERKSGRLTLTPPRATPLGWKIRSLLDLVCMPVLLLIVSPLLLLALPFILLRLRWCERTDPVLAPRVAPQHAGLLSSIEDQDVTNQFSAMGSVKPGLFRHLIMASVLMAINYTTAHIFNRGRLARVTSIQFARWVFLDKGKRVIFCSNYDGSLESYMDDFINKVFFGLNVVFSNGIGYPRTNWLLLNGARDEQAFKDYLRRHQMLTQVWYDASPGLTALNKRRNALIREGFEKSDMTTAEIKDWLALF
jgi:hypothetical protein